MVLSLIALWLWQGGYWKIAKFAEIIPNPLNATSTSDNLYQLPGQPEFFQVEDTTSGADEMEYGAADYENPTDALYDVNYGNRSDGPSPYVGYVELQIGAAQSSSPSDEYIVIRATVSVGTPITVSGWKLQSARTGTRAVVPLAASPFIQGSVNRVRPIVLNAGESVVVSSGVSPVGVSFRESGCTGYLAQTQRFSPPLSNACLRPTNLLPRTSENEARYGSSCLNFVEHLPQCSYPTSIPNDVSPTCRTFLSNSFTYSGCVRAYGTTNMLSTWRAYESSSSELWENTGDTIVLTDEEGRAVATLSY